METLLFNLYEDGILTAQEKWKWDESFNMYRIYIRYNLGFANRDFQESNIPALVYKRELVKE